MIPEITSEKEIKKMAEDARIVQDRINALFNDDEFSDMILDVVAEREIREPDWWTKYREEL